MTALSAVCTEVRDATLDETATYRVSDAKLVTYANGALREMCLLRPDLFSASGDITCTQSKMIQSAPAASVKLLNVYGIKNGAVIAEIDWQTLNLRYPNKWKSAASGAALYWIRHETNPNKFYCFPPAPASQTLDGEWAAAPTALTATSDAIPVSDIYIPAIRDYMIFRIESREDEYVNSGRAQMHLEKFYSLLGVTKSDIEKVAKQPPQQEREP